MSIAMKETQAPSSGAPVPRNRGGPRAGSGRPVSPDAAEALKELLIEATLLHWHVAAATRAFAGPSDLTNAQVSILRTIHSGGAQTVPQLAAARSIARQPVQRSVGELAAQGFVRLAPNPRHKRSRLVTLTPAGHRRLREMERRQTCWVRRMSEGVTERSLRTASRLLRRIRQQVAARMSHAAPTQGG